MLFGYNQSNFNRELIMKKHMFLILLSLFSILFTSCSTKIDDSISKSNEADISNLLDQLAQKEKEINDIIKDLKFSINDYQNAICECENIGLRQTLQQIRNNEESLQYDLVKIANIKGYSNPSSKAETKEIENLKRQFQ